MEEMSAFNSTQLLNDTSLGLESVPIAAKLFRICFFTLVFLLGVPGNSLILCVYWTKTLQTSTHVFIMALAWADLAICIFKVANIAGQILLWTGHQTPVIVLLLLSFNTTAVGTSIMITALIAADRYDCVCRPHRRFFTHRRGKIAAWASVLFSVVINIPEYVGIFPDIPIPNLPKIRLAFHAIICAITLVMIAVCYTLVYKAIKQHVKVGAGSSRTPLEQNECSTKHHSSVVPESSSIHDEPKPGTSRVQREVCGASLPTHATGENDKDRSFGVYSTSPQHALTTHPRPLNIELGLGTNSSKRHPEQHHNAALLQRKTTKMLFVTSVVFFMTWMPYWVLIAVSFAVQSGVNIDPILFQVMDEMHVMLYINNVVNPLIYGIANRRFRKDCRDVIRKFKIC